MQVPEQLHQQYLEVLLCHCEAISQDKFYLGQTDTLMHEIALKTQEPTYINQFKIPDAHFMANQLLMTLIQKLLIARNVARQNNEDSTDQARFQFDAKATPKKFLPNQLVLLDEHSFLGKNWLQNGQGHTKSFD